MTSITENAPDLASPGRNVDDREVLLRVDGVSKKFCKHLKRSMVYGLSDLARNLVGLRPNYSRLRKEEFWATRGVSFKLREGDRLGIIGANGSGKSTLLRMIAGIYAPDEGSITVRGQVGSLIALGVGFHPHMTGRENIFLNGSIIGMRRDEIDAKFASIVEFADIGDFLDAPVAAYSSGMKVRLGFAIAIHADPDLLVIDEVMSVGDAGFRHKANRHMQTYRQKAKAILFVSHDMSMIRQTCNRLLWLEEGQVIYSGSVSEGILRYEEMCKSAGESLDQKERQKAKNYVAIAQMQEALEIERVGVLDASGAPTTAVRPGEPLRIYCDMNVRRELAHLTLVAYIRDRTGDSRPLAMMRAYDDGFVIPLQQPGRIRVVVETDQHCFAPGMYMPIIEVINGKSYELYSAEHSGAPFAVGDDAEPAMEYPRGYAHVAERWSASPARN